MQPEPIEFSTDTSNTVNTAETDNTSQYGFLPQGLHLADLRGHLSDGSVVSRGSRRTPDAAVEAYSSDEVELREENLRRLSPGDSHETRLKASFQRISEYESASSLSPLRKQYEGPAFKVINKKGNKLDGPQLNDFPNEVLTHILSHLPATSLSAVSLVSRQFYNLVTTPHAWRIAFSRFFPGQDAVIEDQHIQRHARGLEKETSDPFRSEQRFFTRLTALASWRSEYILRTRLLRSLTRGKPSQIAPGHGASSRTNSAANNANAVVTYSSQLFATINHIHAVFSTGKKSPRFIHGTDETGSACTSDPNIGKIDNWGSSDPQALPQFSDLFVGDLPYGDGEGPAGLPNCMDVSQPFGMIYGEGFPGGQAYFRSSEEMRGRFLSQPVDLVDHQSGIPRIPSLTEAISAVRISKSNCIPSMTSGLVGIMTGSTLGIVTSYSLGAETSFGRRVAKGQITARWVLSPGVPIIAIEFDESYNASRKASGRLWAIALNALGEVFYLTKTPSSALLDTKIEDGDAERHAWNAGRTVSWQLIEPSRRVAQDDPYREAEVHGSYSPRSSSKSMHLSKAQVIGETLEIEKFLTYRPSHFRNICKGWDMRRRLEVDFAGDDGNGAGEGIFVISCGLMERKRPEIKRFTRWKSEQASREEYPMPKTPPLVPRIPVSMASLFGGGRVITPARTSSPEQAAVSPFSTGDPVRSSARSSSPDNTSSLPASPLAKKISTSLMEEWRSSILSLKEQPEMQITASAIDSSSFAILTVDEDPLRTINGVLAASTPSATPSDIGNTSSIDVPGSRARLFAIGTNTGVVVIWNMRGPQSSTAGSVNQLQPIRTIQTDSPQISCLAVSALYLVHGGNDGLVQTWDPLASTLLPVRTLNSKFSSRARRRLVQAEASVHGVGINEFAAGAICIDPDPTVLRGMVSLGTHLRYWSYSSSASDQYQSKKRRLRRSFERGSNSGPDRFTSTGRGALMDYIATEQEELKREKVRRSREEARLRGRFGVGLGGLNEEEALRYAELISVETFQKDQERRTSDAGYVADAGENSSATATPEGSVKSQTVSPQKIKDDEFDHDLEEAIRLSLLDGIDSGGCSPRASGSGQYDIPIHYKPRRSRRSASSSPSTSQAPKHRSKAHFGEGSGDAVAVDDLDFALQLSLAEERSRMESAGLSDGEQDEFPSLEDRSIGKGKGKAT